MENFDAISARLIVQHVSNTELNSILSEIKKAAEMGQRGLYIYKTLSIKTIGTLKDKGFDIDIYTGIEVQRDGLYYNIKW